MDFDKLNRVLTPAHEIKDPHFFVGRREELRTSLLALREPGSFLAIWGNRGAGKSSLAMQLVLMAQGDMTLADLLGLKPMLGNKKLRFLVQHVSCDKFTSSILDLVQRIVFGDQRSQSLFRFTKDGDQKKARFEKTFSIQAKTDFGFAGVSLDRSKKETFEKINTSDVIQQFKSLLGIIRAQHKGEDGLLLVVDEFDLIRDKEGFASLVKSCSDDFVKFCSVGIGSDLRSLLGDHASITRQIKSVQIPRMTSEELVHIINNAEKELSVEFDQDLIKRIITSSEGFPYFVHLLGRACLLRASEENVSKISIKHLEVVMDDLKRGTLAPIYEELYQIGVKHSPQREILLKAFADSHEEIISTTDTYETARGMGITNPSQLMKELTAPEGFEPILVQVMDRQYRFSDPVFRTYVKLRSWKF